MPHFVAMVGIVSREMPDWVLIVAAAAAPTYLVFIVVLLAWGKGVGRPGLGPLRARLCGSVQTLARR